MSGRMTSLTGVELGIENRVPLGFCSSKLQERGYFYPKLMKIYFLFLVQRMSPNPRCSKLLRARCAGRKFPLRRPVRWLSLGR